ncbi:MAG TPA: J domain-containing protein [Caulobacteraceae bacterium]|jgi:curved DNA-binding protein CbpA
MPGPEDHFEILGLKRSASAEEIRAAYRRAAKTTHPDRGGSNEAFRRVQMAAEFLLAEVEKRSLTGQDTTFRQGDRTSVDGDWREVSQALSGKWALGLGPVMVFAPQKIGLSPFAAGTTLNLPAYRWLTRTVGPRGEAWDFHVEGSQTRIFFRRADDARLFKLRFF